MKTTILIIVATLLYSFSFAKVPVNISFKLPNDKVKSFDVAGGSVEHVTKELKDLKAFNISADLKAKHELWITVGDQKLIYNKTGKEAIELQFSVSVINKMIKIEHIDNTGLTPKPIEADKMEFKILNDIDEEQVAEAKVHVKLFFILPDGEEFELDATNDDVTHVTKDLKELKKFSISAPLADKHEIWFKVGGETAKYTSTNNEKKEFEFKKSILKNEILVQHIDNTTGDKKPIAADQIKFRIVNDKDPLIVKTGNSTDDDENGCAECDINKYVNDNYSDESLFERTAFGIYEKSTKTIHIFFDQYGNSILSTVPQGIANAKYMVHIIYPYLNADPDAVSYSVKQKSGTFNSGITFNNNNIRKDLGVFQSGKKYDGLKDKSFLLSTASNDLKFDLLIAYYENGKRKKEVLDTYTISMSPTYHGSFDIGLLRSNLDNPTFSLVTGPAGTDKFVKATDGSPRGVVTVMATYYISPIILLESLIPGSKIPFYKLTGRNFLDDHKFYERIYPAVGVSISSKSYENLFYGFNFEIARGLDFFAGWHFGKVNVFEMPEHNVGVTPVTQQQFDFYSNTRWKTSSAFGLKIDPLIIKNLFAPGP